MADSFSVQITGIVQRTPEGLICYDITSKTLVEASSTPSFSTIAVVTITSSTSTVHQFIDLNKLQNKYDFGLETWNDIIVLYNAHHNDPSWSDVFSFTDVPRQMHYTIDGRELLRSTPFQSNIKDRISIFSMDHSDYVTGSYLNKKAPYVRNVKSRIRTMPDLVFTKTDKADINFANTLVSVDGNMGYPEYDANTDELYIKNGAYYLRGTYTTPDQNVVFMDFTGMVKKGTSLIHKYFHQCAPELIIGQGDQVEIYHNDVGVVETLLSRKLAWWKQCKTTIKFTVPLRDIEFDKTVEYVPLVSFGGRLFFPGIDNVTYRQYALVGAQHYMIPHIQVELTLDLDQLSAIVASNLQHAGIFMGNSSFYHTAITYVLSNIFTPSVVNIPTSTDEWRAIGYLCKADIPFVTILQMDKEYAFSKIESSMTLHDGDMIFPHKSRGLLITKQTKEIIDYNFKDGTNLTIVEAEPRKALYLSERGHATAHLNRTQGPVTQIQGSADIAKAFPASATFTYSALDGNCYVVRSDDGVILAKSNQTTASVPYTNTSLVWTIYETTIEIPDSMRYHDIVSEDKQDLVVDAYNRVPTGINIKNINECYMLDIRYVGKESLVNEQISTIDDSNQNTDIPNVHTIEYRTIIDPVKKGTNV